MEHVLNMSVSVVTQGLVYALVATAVYLTSRIIRFDDLSVEGSFGLGGAVGCQMLIWGWHPIVSLLVSGVFGGMLGVITSLLNLRLGLNNLIAGLVVTTAVFSIALGTVGANVSLMSHAADEIHMLVMALICVGIIFPSVSYFLSSEIGLLMKALGENPSILTQLNKSIARYQTLMLGMANFLTAIAGALFVQMVGFYSITANVGTLVIGLSALILGELFGRSILSGILLGSIFYQLIFVVTLEMQIAPQWNNLVKAILIVGLIALRRKHVAA